MKIVHGECVNFLLSLEANTIDALITDPPAGISFMGKEWDGDKGGRKQWVAWMTEVMTECMRVMKPGAHGLVWALPRTSHWTATALEDAGFEVRDVVTHLFGTGFPKSLDLEKATEGVAKGQGTALKPASEHWILVRKPISEKTVAVNVLKWGCGGLNIDGCRVDGQPRTTHKDGSFTGSQANKVAYSPYGEGHANVVPTGRFPANLVLDEEAAQALDEQSGTLKSGGFSEGQKQVARVAKSKGAEAERFREARQPDVGGASRFFYVAKASKADKGTDNTHPTVKSTKLMEYLIKLVTPPNGVVLDPFMGSGSTGVSAKNLGFKFLGIESSSDYFGIASRRVKILDQTS